MQGRNVMRKCRASIGQQRVGRRHTAKPRVHLGVHQTNRQEGASSELFREHYHYLVCYLRRRYPLPESEFDEDLYYQAAMKALEDLNNRPHRFDPRRSSLRSYLRMAARRDLYNLVGKEMRRRTSPLDVAKGQCSGNSIEDQVIGKLDAQTIRSMVRKSLSQREWLVFKLMEKGERRTAVYARALGIECLPREEQARRVKREKDRIRKRLKRKLGKCLIAR